MKSVPILVIMALLAMGCPTDDSGDGFYHGRVGGGDDDAGDDDAGDDDGVWCTAPITDLQIHANPENELGFWASWTTPVPAPSRVEFGQDGLRFFVQDDKEDTDHRIFVYGMKPETNFQLVAASVAKDDVYCSELEQFGTGAVPFADADVRVTAYDEERALSGWTLANFLQIGGDTRVYAVIWDMDGDPVWYYELGFSDGRGDQEVSLAYEGGEPRILIGGGVPSGTSVLEVALDGSITWEGPVQADYIGVKDDMHHCFHQTTNGTYIYLLHQFDGSGYSDIREIDRDQNLIWKWSLFQDTEWDFLDYGNYTDVDYGNDVVYYNENISHNFYKVDRTSREVVWQLGPGGDFEIIPPEAEPWTEFTHAAKVLENGHVLIYDNGKANPGSRVYEWELDESAMTAKVVWEFDGGETPFYNTAWGDADRLENGNTLITAGYQDQATGYQSRIIEAAPDGTIVWQLSVQEVDPFYLGSYMAERIPVLLGQK
ncbi:aryl-sulfate sulfotransferase [Patescibacteria group bacterium]|nr:aryl-sulfate sulfotransferase [Patescibacteria group bacterium]MBU1964137.1 aryl-sulfate sulfotransferase [Patescibacteria group bacterium]